MTSFLVIVFGTLFTAVEVITTLVFFQFTDTIAGFTIYEFLALTSTFELIGTAYQILFINAHENLSDKILDGELDYDLIRPVSSLFFNNVRQIEISSIINLIVPVSILIYSIVQMGGGTLSGIIGYAAFVAAGVYFYYLLNQFFVSLSFWVERPGRLLGVPEYVFDLAAKPRGVYPRIWQVIFAWIIPVVTATNLPVDILKGNFSFAQLLVYLAVITMFTVIVRIEWKLGIRRYTSAN